MGSFFFSIFREIKLKLLLKDKFASKQSNYLLTVMLLESQVAFYSPQNISGASQQNSVAAFP